MQGHTTKQDNEIQYNVAYNVAVSIISLMWKYQYIKLFSDIKISIFEE